jgi:hypothetical protein
VLTDSGECKCIEGASRKDGTQNRCTCDEPTDAAREPFFELIPKKRCRSRCKDGTREVFGDMSSTCMQFETYKAVMLAAMSEHDGGVKQMKQGRCTEGFSEIPKGDGSECISSDYVKNIVSL